MKAINLADKLSTFAEHWQPRVVGHVLLIEPQGTPNTGNAATAAIRRVI
jgi:hypothetical protein